jgi:hypothetical protein
MRGGVAGGGDGHGAANPASVGSLRSLSHMNSLRRGVNLPFTGNGATRMTKSRSFANLSGKTTASSAQQAYNFLILIRQDPSVFVFGLNILISRAFVLKSLQVL